jgi:hypothetical protein
VIARLLIALIGAAVITVGLLLFMNEAANRFVLRDPMLYFRIADFIPAPDRGRQRPEAPPSPELAPERPQLDFEDTNEPSEVTEVPTAEVDAGLQGPGGPVGSQE